MLPMAIAVLNWVWAAQVTAESILGYNRIVTSTYRCQMLKRRDLRTVTSSWTLRIS